MLRIRVIQDTAVQVWWRHRNRQPLHLKRTILRNLTTDIRLFANWLPRILCYFMGGHDFSEWCPRASYNILDERAVHFTRRCRTCEHEERVEAPSDTPGAVEPFRFI